MIDTLQRPQAASGVLLATLLLPGLAALSALTPINATAESAPEKTTIALKYGHYNDSQPGWDRIEVNASQVYFQAPVAGEWSIEGSVVGDSVSGASPRLYTRSTQLSGASHMSDERLAGDLKVTRYFSRAAVSASVAYSTEHDYVSRAVGLDGRWSSEDNNRTWTLGIGNSSDDINKNGSIDPTNTNQHKHTLEIMGGVTQTLTPADIVQINFTRSTGQGYYNDPYKTGDKRPDQRDAWIGLVRWNHYLDPLNASLRSSYRYYSDTFGVDSHTFGLDWVQPVGQWTFTPGVRYYSQSAANFYRDPLLTPQGQYDEVGNLIRAYTWTGNNSADQRLAAFGAVTLSIKVAYAFTPDTVVDVKYEDYRQRAGLRLGGSGSPNLDPFNASFVQVGLTHRF